MKRPKLLLLMLALVVVCACSSAQAQTTVRYIHTDVLGSIVAETDEAGNVVARRE